MRCSLVFSAVAAAKLRNALRAEPFVERAALLLCREVKTAASLKLLVLEVVEVAQEHYLHQHEDGMSMSSAAYVPVAKTARRMDASIVFVHSHPPGALFFSAQDDREEPKLLDFFRSRIPSKTHGAVVVSGERLLGRLRTPRVVLIDVIVEWDGQWRVHGERSAQHLAIFDRSVRAIGRDGQALLGQLVVGIVGGGGTGSAVAEAITRLGVGALRLFDDDKLEDTNVPRVLGATMADIGRYKVEVLREHLLAIGLSTDIVAVTNNICVQAAAERLRDCDIIFSCVDKEIPRSILMAHHIHYLTPIIDIGVVIEAPQRVITQVWGRVTTMTPGGPCLFCRGRISADGLRLEAMQPRERQAQIRQGYAPELEEAAPAVVAYTMAVASIATAELMARLFMPGARSSLGDETLMRLDSGTVRSNSGSRRASCYCANEQLTAAGDVEPYLGLAWV